MSIGVEKRALGGGGRYPLPFDTASWGGLAVENHSRLFSRIEFLRRLISVRHGKASDSDGEQASPSETLAS